MSCVNSVKAKWQQAMVLHRRADLSECVRKLLLLERRVDACEVQETVK